MIQPVGFRPKQAASPKRLKGRRGESDTPILPGTEAVIASVQLYENCVPVLESLYYDGSAGGDGSLEFKVTLDGVELPYDWAKSYNPIGAAGNPVPIGQDLPPGRLLEVRCRNHHETESFGAYCDGEVCFYAAPLE